MRVTTVAIVTSIYEISKSLDEISYYEVYSIATSSFTPPHALAIYFLQAISITSNETQQKTRTEHLPKNDDLTQRKQL